MLEYTIDRIENGIVVLIGNDGYEKKIPQKNIPFDIAEGDKLVFNASEEDIKIVEESALKEASDVNNRLNNLFNRKKNNLNYK